MKFFLLIATIEIHNKRLQCNCCVRQDGTRFDIKCAFNYSDNLVIINQVTPVTIQNKKSFRNNTYKNTNKIGNMVKKYQCNI